MTPDLAGVGDEIAVWLVIVAIPIVLVAATSFTKTTVVLGALRVGLGAEALLPMAMILALALVLTGVVMGPTLAATIDAVTTGGGVDAVITGGPPRWLAIADPLRSFLQRHADPEELRFFAELQGRGTTDPLVVVPAFLVTELAEAFRIAVLLVVPFLVIDLVAAQTLAVAGLVQQPLPLLTLPLKLLLFLAVGGWDIVIGGLVEGYR